MVTKLNKINKYRKEYYQKNKDKIRAYQKERYWNKTTNKGSIGMPIDPTHNSHGTTFYSLDQPNVTPAASPQSIMKHLKSWIFSCANINASSVASQNLHLYATVEKGQSNKFLHKNIPASDKVFRNLKQRSSINKSLSRIKLAESVVEIVDHPVLDLLNSINSFNNNFESFELTSMYLDMIGDSYWWIRKDKLGIPYEIWVLQAQYMKIVPSERNFIKGYVYGASSLDITDDLVKFDIDEIIHFKTPNPNSLYYGLGAAQAVISAINRMNYMDISEMSRLRNMGRPDFIVNYKGGKLDTSELRKVERLWNNAYGGPHKDGKIKVMDEDFDLKTLGFSPRDMEYLKGRQWSLKEIASAFGIPYSILDVTDTKKATSDMAEYWYTKNSVLPRITRIQEKLNERLLPLYDNTGRMFLAYDNPVPEDREILLKENVEYVRNGIIAINEARISLGMDKIDDKKFDIPRPFAFNQYREDQGLEDGEKGEDGEKEEETPEKPKKPKKPKEREK